MGYYNSETIKEDARRHGVATLNPDINLSLDHCTIHDESVLLGFRKVKDVGPEAAGAIVAARERGGSFTSLGNAMERTRLKRVAVVNLVRAGAFDSLVTDRRNALWEVGLRYQAAGDQLPLSLPVEYGMAPLSSQSDWDIMLDEYAVLGMYPRGHIMAMVRPWLSQKVATSRSIVGLRSETPVVVAGRAIRRQRPLGEAVYLTLEDEFGHSPLIVWPRVYQRLRPVLGESLLVVAGEISRRDGTMNIAVRGARTLRSLQQLPRSRNWG
jgi:error-prone DNA polymerase